MTVVLPKTAETMLVLIAGAKKAAGPLLVRTRYYIVGRILLEVSSKFY